MNIDLNKYRPVFYLHHHERYYPIDITRYLDNSILLYNGKQVAKSGDLTIDNLSGVWIYDNTLLDASTDKKFSINPEPYILGGIDDDPASVPVYAKINDINDNYYHILFFYIHAFNGGYDRCGITFGEHMGDIEHVTIEVHKNTLDINRVFFSAHGSKEGVWVNRENIEFIGNRPVVYIALNSHAAYWAEGTYVRAWFLANDKCSRGVLWDPCCIEVDDNTSWVKYAGKYGKDGVDSLINRGWWNQEMSKNKKSGIRHIFKRLFLC